MTISEDARVTILIADHIAVDSGGKVTALGAGFSLAGIGPSGFSAPQSVVVWIDVPADYVGQEFAFLLELRDESTGQAAQVPTGPTGTFDALRIQQVAVVERAQAQGVYLPADAMFSRVQITAQFPNGIPLRSGTMYHWRVEVDGQTRADWQARFYAPGPPPGPVFGGPAGPGSIPGMPL